MTQPHLAATAFPVSIKGVVVRDELVVLLKNERDEWELPGGQIEIGETPAQCVAREIAEETRWLVATGPLLDAWMYQVVPGHHVFVVVYGCYLHSGSGPVLSHEHKEIGLFTQHEVAELVMAEDYKRSVAMWFARLHHGAPEKIR